MRICNKREAKKLTNEISDLDLIFSHIVSFGGDVFFFFLNAMKLQQFHPLALNSIKIIYTQNNF